MAVLNTHDNPRRRQRTVAARLISGALAFAFGAAIAVSPVLPAQSSKAVDTPSSLTVKWLGDTSSAAGYQAPRNANSPHYNEMKNIQITVSQTTQIIDQAVRISVTGFAGTKSAFNVADNAQNFLQAMQCWGDPKAADFVQTCQWGGRNSGTLDKSVYPDNYLRVSTEDNTPSPATSYDNPFKTVDGKLISAKTSILPPKPGSLNGQANYPILSYFGPSTTNEVASARVGADGSGYFDFETQSSSQSPQLGCGSAEHLRCWLVIVPRGTKFGGKTGAADPLGCSDIVDFNGESFSYGRANSVQAGSPVNPKCDYFDNRIVVPLDFTPTGATCPVGSTEFRVSGSQMMISAMSSWQPSLCQNVQSTFSFSTNSDSLARAQLLETRAGSPLLVYSGYPLSSNELDNESDRTLLGKTTLKYAPVAVSSIVVAFNAEFAGGRQQNLVLTPRLMAKILTQSYTFTVPINTSDPSKNVAHLSDSARKYNYWNADPDFRRANPTNWQAFDQQNPSVVLPGPSGADGIKQVWRWIIADSDAVHFLSGAPDPDGMTINPYYLPKGDPKAVVPWWLDASGTYMPTPVQKPVGEVALDGSPLAIGAMPLDIFPKDDNSLVPLQKTGGEKSRFDSIQFAPYALDFLAGARQAFRGDPNSKTIWDAQKLNDAGDAGAWVTTGIQPPGNRFMIAVTDSASAARYGMTTTALTPANSTSPVQSSAASMAVALQALTPTTLDSILQIDPAKVSGGGYPLTIITYAGVNLTKSTATARATIAKMIQQVTSAGQVSGSAIGELPLGYLPLTGTMKDQAAATSLAIQNWTPEDASSGAGNANSNNYSVPSAYSAADGLVDPTASTTNPKVTAGADTTTTERTLASAGSPLNAGLAIALLIGSLGFIIAPILLRGRGYL